MATTKGQFTNRQYGVELELNVPFQEVTLRGTGGAGRTRSMSNHTTLARYLRQETGLEVFAEGWNHDTVTYWKIVPDGSVRADSQTFPCEIVSPPMKGTAGLADIAAMCEVLNDLGCTINRSHGMHIHTDINDWKKDVKRARRISAPATTKKLLNLSKKKVAFMCDIFGRYEPAFFGMQPKSRMRQYRGRDRAGNRVGGFNDWSFGNGSQLYPVYFQRNEKMQRVSGKCKVAKRLAMERIEEFLLCNGNGYNDGSLQRNGSSNARYCTLNWGSYWKYGTVENRMAAGTVNYDKIVTWIMLCQAMVETAERMANADRTKATPDSPISKDETGKLLRSMKMNLGFSLTPFDRESGLEVSGHYKRAAEFYTKRHSHFKRTQPRNYGFGWEAAPATILNDPARS